MPFFKSINDRDSTTTNGIPRDGGFGHKNLRKYEEERQPSPRSISASSPTDQTNHPTKPDPACNSDVMSGGGGGGGGGVGPQADDDTHTNKPRSRYSQSSVGDGGFISQSHAAKLGREGEARRRQQQLDQNGRMGTRDELDAMGFDSDSPPPPTPSKGEKQAMATRQRAVENGALLPAW